MNIKEKLAELAAEMEKTPGNPTRIGGHAMGMLADLKEDQCVIPENVLEVLDNRMQRNVLLAFVTTVIQVASTQIK